MIKFCFTGFICVYLGSVGEVHAKRIFTKFCFIQSCFAKYNCVCMNAGKATTKRKVVCREKEKVEKENLFASNKMHFYVYFLCWTEQRRNGNCILQPIGTKTEEGNKKKKITRKLLAKGGAFSGTRSIVLIRIPPNGIINIWKWQISRKLESEINAERENELFRYTRLIGHAIIRVVFCCLV